jgi:limonene-1,2-epoxide hydrolase
MTSIETTMVAQNRQITESLLDALSRRDWDSLKTYLAPDAYQQDLGTPVAAAHGPEGIAGRMSLVLDPLEEYEVLEYVTVAEGDLVMAEIKERWKFSTGAELVHPWVSVTEVRDGKIVRWCGYSDGSNITGQAPADYTGMIATKLIAAGELNL